MNLSIIQTITVWILPVLLSITLHEAAHALVANLCGDSTSKMMGRLTANPIKHIDLFGTIIVPLLVAVLSGFHFVFGWAKPVPINWYQLKKPRRDMALVALAGPTANIIMIILWALLTKFGYFLGPQTSKVALFMVLTGEAGIIINLVLAIINLIPLPPLDGSRVVMSILPAKLAFYYAGLERFGLVIAMILMFTGILGRIVSGPFNWSVEVICSLFGICH